MEVAGNEVSQQRHAGPHTFKEDLVDRGVDWNSIRAVATDRHRWQTVAAHCPDKDWRI